MRSRQLILAENVAMEFGERELFRFERLTVYEGEKVGLAGANGAGKTTLLRVLAGELKPTRGNVKMDGDAAFDDWILTKSNHRVMLMIEKLKNHIMLFAEDKVLYIDKKDIEQYLSEVKEAVENDRYRLDRNARRQDNINLFLDYVMDEAKAKETILSLAANKLKKLFCDCYFVP